MYGEGARLIQGGMNALPPIKYSPANFIIIIFCSCYAIIKVLLFFG